MTEQSYFVGALPPEQFLATLMDVDESLPPAPSVDFRSLHRAESVTEAQHSLIDIVEKSGLCPGLRMFVAKFKQQQVETLQHEDSQVDNISEVPPYPSIGLRAQSNSRRRTRKPRDIAEYYDFGTGVLGVELVRDCDADPFLDAEDYDPLSDSATSSHAPKSSDSSVSTSTQRSRLSEIRHCSSTSFDSEPFSIERRSAGAASLRSRILASAKAHFACQHRRFLFYVVIIYNTARFMLIDRSGAVVSERVEYMFSPHILAEFFWRFAHMTDAQRGQDTTATRASRREATLFADAVRAFLDGGDKHRALPDAQRTLDSSDTFPVWKIHVTNPATGKSSDVVVQRPFAGSASLFGRGTRAYLAYDLSQHHLIFMKDSWRMENSPFRPEFDTYQQLHSHNIPSIPRIHYGGDVLGADGQPQMTIAHTLTVGESTWRFTEDALKGYTHHRIAQDILYPLECVHEERELVQALHDTLIAIDTAHRETGILHRDISWKNVMLDSNGRCMLNDWDHAGPHTSELGATGTPQFMSVRLLTDDELSNELVDDLQSVFWVLNFTAVFRFSQHMLGLSDNLFVFGARDSAHEMAIAKAAFLGRCWDLPDRYASPALAGLIQDVRMAWGEYQYALVGPRTDMDLTEPNYEMLKRAAQPAYWLEKFAAALRKYDADQDPAGDTAAACDTPSRPQRIAEVHTPADDGLVVKKRKRAEPDVGTQTGRQVLRRSKRLRANQ